MEMAEDESFILSYLLDSSVGLDVRRPQTYMTRNPRYLKDEEKTLRRLW